ncbi:hypothetical protein NP590_11350 [Methylomonas sp. SURF-2]|uniref:DUF1566 domain-containing protein n=1 Tax=Methylomonas subterranea TaxID=2952225 RepID=A0ABT1THH0_9GAMM|nr:hypothetical protein [Methylomonas sp. SURF-2]MCQ8104703.1 hypothetical protein [Methylomonas sp. SURF-2]
MKYSTKHRFSIGLLLSFTSLTTQAALHDRGGGLIYDDVLNVTWLQDANYAATQGYSLLQNGRYLSWYDALTWAENLTYFDSVRNVTWTDWRLPKITPLDPTIGWQMQISTNGDQDDAYNVSAPGTKYAGSTASELPYMFFNNLGNTSRCPVGFGFADCSTDSYLNYTLNTGIFINMEKGGYWTGSDENLPFKDGWGFDMGAQWGLQGAFNAGVPRIAWAVRDGDVAAVPLPSAIYMFAAAITGFLSLRRKHHVGICQQPHQESM